MYTYEIICTKEPHLDILAKAREVVVTQNVRFPQASKLGLAFRIFSWMSLDDPAMCAR